MTKEEYQKLLESDYWKGFSYSIIKERNFTCQDCGAYYPGERNQLQVHHLVYRDIMPWSYNPEEMVVLCRSCHAKRHGLSPSANQPNKNEGSYTKTYNSYNESSRSSRKKDYSLRIIPAAVVAFFVLLMVVFVSLEYANTKERVNNMLERSGSPDDLIMETKRSTPPPPPPSNSSTKKKKKSNSISSPKTQKKDSPNQLESSVALPIVSNAEVPVAAPAGEESISDIQERLDRKYWENRAKEEGVSTEGSISDIQERLDRKYWEDRAREKGVSTEGSISDIQERLDRKYWEFRAREEGVSTEGSISDIQERLDRKYWEKRAREEGVSTEGSISDIQERLNRKYWEDRAKEN